MDAVDIVIGVGWAVFWIIPYSQLPAVLASPGSRLRHLAHRRSRARHPGGPARMRRRVRVIARC